MPLPADQSPRPSADTQPDVSIIIVNFRTPDDVIECLASLEAHADGFSLEIIVVDNDSGDGSSARIRAACPRARVIDAGCNGGFAMGNNIGLREARGRFLLLLNPDTEVPAGLLGGVFGRLANEPAVGLVGVPQMLPGGQVVGSAMRELLPVHFLLLSFLTDSFIARFMPSKCYRYGSALSRAEFACDAVVGCFMAMRRDVYQRVGGLDERIFMYAEELEYAHRVRQAGYSVLHMGGLHVVHKQGVSTRNISVWRDVQMQQGQLVYVRLTQGHGAARLTGVIMTLSHLLRLPIELAMPGPKWRTRLDSRLRRLRRSVRAIFSPPERTVQAI